MKLAKFGKFGLQKTLVRIQTAFTLATVLLAAVALVPVRVSADPIPPWFAGQYDGIFAGPPTKCIHYSELHEPAPFTVSLRSGSIGIHFTSPFGTHVSYRSPLIRDGRGIVLKGTFQTTNKLGSGPFSGRIFVGDHALIIVTSISPAHAPSCKLLGILSGIRRPLTRLDLTY